MPWRHSSCRVILTLNLTLTLTLTLTRTRTRTQAVGDEAQVLAALQHALNTFGQKLRKAEDDFANGELSRTTPQRELVTVASQRDEREMSSDGRDAISDAEERQWVPVASRGDSAVVVDVWYGSGI